jgi:twitching motility protein PilT
MNYAVMTAIEQEASDLHITENKEIWIRANGIFTKLDCKVTLADMDEFIEYVVPNVNEEYSKLRNNSRINPIDGSFFYMGRRFRINIYRGMDGINMALRLLSDEIQSLEKLCLPSAITNFIKIQSGLFLVVGTTGSGKSTTLASMINEINHQRSENILTIEQPIEYIHIPHKSRIEQIEVGVHVDSFKTATIAAMRQNPNIILVGEMRDLDTIQNAITLAETGHVVYGTLHAKSVTDAVDRIIDVFDPKQQEQIRMQLAGVLKGILHQSLIRSVNGGLVPLVELLAVDDVVSAMILEKQKSNAIRDYMRGKSAFGNVHIADNAAWHIQNGRLSLDNIKNILSQDDYSMAKNISNSQNTRRGFGG